VNASVVYVCARVDGRTGGERAALAFFTYNRPNLCICVLVGSNAMTTSRLESERNMLPVECECASVCVVRRPLSQQQRRLKHFWSAQDVKAFESGDGGGSQRRCSRRNDESEGERGREKKIV